MLDPNHILLLKVSQIVGPPTFLWDWQKFAFCQSYVRQKIWGIREICICIFFLNFLFEVVYNQYIFKMYWLNHFWIKKTSSIFVVDLILMHNQKFSGEARPKVQVRYCHLVPTVVILHPINFHISILFVEYHWANGTKLGRNVN
jgi:hypothetical protein